MPLQNRVNPYGHIHAVPERGDFMGNRGGSFHRNNKTLKPTHWVTRQWIICKLEFQGRRRKLMKPGSYTELFFLDEATALAAGHRPCFECRRTHANAFQDALMARGMFGERPSAEVLSDAIAGEVQNRLKKLEKLETVSANDLPDGAMFLLDLRAWLKLGDQAYPWSFAGYGAPTSIPRVPVERLTPFLTIEALKGGYQPQLHASINPLAG